MIKGLVSNTWILSNIGRRNWMFSISGIERTVEQALSLTLFPILGHSLLPLIEWKTITKKSTRNYCIATENSNTSVGQTITKSKAENLQMVGCSTFSTEKDKTAVLEGGTSASRLEQTIKPWTPRSLSNISAARIQRGKGNSKCSWQREHVSQTEWMGRGRKPSAETSWEKDL